MSLFGNQNNAGGSSLFGNNAQNQTANKPPALNLFGISNSNNNNSNTAQTTSAAPAGGLFGTAQNTTSTGGSSLFGNNNNQTQTGGSLFGGAMQNQAAAPAQTTSLFGATNAAATATQPQQGASLFGSAPAGGMAQSGTGLFGQSQQQQPQQQQQQPQQQQQAQSMNGSAFASGNPTTAGLPSLRFGRNDRPAQTTVPGVKIDVSTLRSTTRFSDLNDDLQRQLIDAETLIEKEIHRHDQCAAMLPAHQHNLASLPHDTALIAGEVDTVELAMYNDSAAIKAVKALHATDVAHARMCFQQIEALKLPAALRAGAPYTTTTPSKDSAAAKHDVVAYFGATAAAMAATLATYEAYVAEIEAHLRSVEASTIAHAQSALFARGADGKGRSGDDQVRELASVLREFEGGILGVAGKVGGVRDEVNRLTLRPRARR